MTVIYAEQILEENGNSEKFVSLEMMAKQATDYDDLIDPSRFFVEEKDEDSKLQMLVYGYDYKQKDEKGKPYYSKTSKSGICCIVYNNEKVVGYCTDYDDEDYHEFNGYWNGLIDGLNLSK